MLSSDSTIATTRVATPSLPPPHATSQIFANHTALYDPTTQRSASTLGFESQSTTKHFPTQTPFISPISSPVQSQNTSDASPSGLSTGARNNIIIIATTIGGTFILAILIYAIWRRRKGATFSDIVHFRPPSGTVTISQLTADRDRLTALPIYRHDLNKRPESPPRAKLSKEPPNQPYSTMGALSSHPLRATRSLDTHLRNTTDRPPKTPTKDGRWQTYLHDATPPPPLPRDHQTRPPPESHTSLGPVSTISLPMAISSTHDEPHAHEPELDPDFLPGHFASPRRDRWSWTNSQAPSTPRIAALSSRLSLANARMRNVENS